MIRLLRSRKKELLVNKRRERLHRLACSWCHDEMLADDLVQDTLTKALGNLQQLSDSKKLDAWLFRILHNTWMDHLRRYKPTTDLDDIDPLETDTPENHLSDEQLAKKVQQAVFNLSIPQRQVITLVDLEGSSYAEVSEILELPIGTVMSRLNRARNTLKKTLIGIKSRESSAEHVDYIRRVK